MKKSISNLFKQPILIALILILIAFMPSAIIKEPDSARRLIVTALGIDKEQDDYVVSALCFIPISTSVYQENYKVISAKDSSFINALNKIGLYSGKITSLPHTSIVVVNENILNQGLTQVIDHLARTHNLVNNTVLVGTDANAKEILEISTKIDKTSNLSLRDLLSYNFEYIYGDNSNIESFYRGYFSPIKTSILGFVRLSEKDGVDAEQQSESSGGTASGGGSTGGSSSGSSSGGTSGGNSGSSQSSGGSQEQSQSSNKKILNDGSACVFKDGKLKLLLDSDMVKYYNWVAVQTNKSIIKIENYNSENFDNATISFQIEQKPVIKKAIFKDGIPEMNYIINFVLTLDEVEQKQYKKENYHLSQKIFTKKMKLKIQNKIRDDFSKLLEVLRENQVDIIDVYETFTYQNKAEFEKFLKKLEDPEDYLRYINFNVVSNVIVKA